MKKSKNLWRETFMALRALGHSVDKIREALHKLGPSQKDVAPKVGMERKCYNNYIGGIRWNRQQQQKIARFWGIPAREYFADTYGRQK